METSTFPAGWADEFAEWLEPVGKNDPETIAQMEHWFSINQDRKCAINVYWCKDGHDTVTIDRVDHAHIETIACPYCKAEARSMYYMVDQTQKPHSEFFRPRDILAYPKSQREAFRQGAVTIKAITSDEKTRFGKTLAARLKPKSTAISPVGQVMGDMFKLVKSRLRL